MLEACKKCRREGEKLMLKGEKCISPKCTMIKRPYAPGDHGQSFRGKVSEYGKQLREKQKAKRIYGISEKQFANTVESAEKVGGNSAENLMHLLEMRLDNIVYRLGWAASRSHSRQLVSHGLIKVNDKKVNIPSYIVKAEQIVEPKDKSKFSELSPVSVPTWLELDAKKITGRLKHVPLREEIDTTINENLIIEYYSR